MWIVSHVLNRGIHTIDHVYQAHFPCSHDLDHGVSGMWLRLGGFSSTGPGQQSKSVIKGALGSLAADRWVEANELTSLLHNVSAIQIGLEGIVDDHFNVSGWSIGP